MVARPACYGFGVEHGADDKSGCQSPSVMDRWVLKIQSLEGKKQHYEDVLRRELDGLDDDFATLKLLSQELSFRAQTIRSQRAA